MKEWHEDAVRQLLAAVATREGAAIVAAADRGADGAPLQLLGDGLLATAHQRQPGFEAAARRCARLLRERGWDGDGELADDLDASLGDGPVRMVQATVPVDLEELASHLDGVFDEGARLDLRTGQVWPADPLATAGIEPPADWEDDDRWLDVYPLGSGPAYADMVDFTETVTDAALAGRLRVALNGKGPFRRFKDVVFNEPEAGLRWRTFADERARGRARAWLAEQRVGAVPPRRGDAVTVPEGATIAAVLEAFLAARAASGTATEHDAHVIELLRDCLDGYGHEHLSPDELALLDAADGDEDDEPAFTEVVGADKIPLGVADLLGWYLLRKILSPSPALLQAAGVVTADLLRWLVAEGYVDQQAVDGAAEAAAGAGYALPRAERLAALLYDTAEATPHADLQEVGEDDIVDDYLVISRVERGKLWFDGFGPVDVPEEASDLAEVGWEANVVLASTPAGWRLVETGNVYP